MILPIGSQVSLKVIEVLVVIFAISCENNYSPEVNDYTGQVDSIIDIDGNSYKTIGIGTQIWMAKNLLTTRLNDGTSIQQVCSDTLWTYLNSPGYCWYNNDSIVNKKVYGALYNYYTVETGLLCPTGWHVPTETEWQKLEKFLGGSEIAGGKLKDYYAFYWNEPNPCLTNNYNFSALPGGKRLTYGIFQGIEDYGWWWTSSTNTTYFAECISMFHESKGLGISRSHVRQGFSVRCIKNKY
jgi:uncharacterized protein (TIGR02145 family)